MELKEIARLYALLAPEERFRLFVEAMGRKGDRDSGRAEATYPWCGGNARDYEHARNRSFFAELAFVTAIQRLRVDLLAMVALVVGLASDGEDDERVATSETAMEAFKKLMRLRHAKRDAWLRFCRRLGEDPDGVVAPFLGDIQWAMEMMQTVSRALGSDNSDESAAAEDMTTGELAALVEIWGGATGTTQ